MDTFAFLAVLNEEDANHPAADEAWKELLAGDEPVVSTNYVLLETIALAQSRLGVKAVRTLARDVFPILTIRWVDEVKHHAGLAALLAAGRRRVSLVDCVSFEVVRELGIRRCFAFDPHFLEQGFESIPG